MTKYKLVALLLIICICCVCISGSDDKDCGVPELAMPTPVVADAPIHQPLAIAETSEDVRQEQLSLRIPGYYYEYTEPMYYEYICNIVWADINEVCPPDVVQEVAKMVWGEGRGIQYDRANQLRSIVWVVMNRLDICFDGRTNVLSIVSQHNQFAGYHSYNPVEQEYVDIVYEILLTWELERLGMLDICEELGYSRCLDSSYLYFHANTEGTYNIFT